MIELPPVVFDEAATDPVAAAIVDRLADEVVAMAEVALRRLDLLGEPVEVLLGGGMFRRADSALVDAIRIALSGIGAVDHRPLHRRAAGRRRRPARARPARAPERGAARARAAASGPVQSERPIYG